MAGSRLHPALVWLPLVGGLALALGWALSRDPSPPTPSDLGTAAPEPSAEATNRTERTAISDGPQGWDAAQPSPALPPPDATPGEPEAASSPSPEGLSGSTAEVTLQRAQALLERKEFGAARREALACLKAEPRHQACQRARVHTYTQQYSMGETKDILGWCLSAFASDLNCLRALREFHASRGESVDASGISAEIRERFPDDDLAMPPLPSPEDAPAERTN